MGDSTVPPSVVQESIGPAGYSDTDYLVCKTETRQGNRVIFFKIKISFLLIIADHGACSGS